MVRIASLALLVTVAACNGGKGGGAAGPGSGSGSSAEPVAVTDVAGLEGAAGKQALVRGLAEDAKLGAEVTLGRTPVYCRGLDRWPAELVGKQVVARGLLESTMEFAPEQDPALPSAGTSGAVWVLRGCTYEAAP
jgi:hypothetical protein